MYDEDRRYNSPLTNLLYAIGSKGRVFLYACFFAATIFFSIYERTLTQATFLGAIVFFIMYNVEIWRGKYMIINIACVLVSVGFICISLYTYEKYETYSTVPAVIAHYRLQACKERIVPCGRYKSENLYMVDKSVSDDELISYFEKKEKLELECRLSSYDRGRMLYNDGKLVAVYHRKEKRQFSIIFIT